MTEKVSLIDTNIKLLEQGIEMLNRISDQQYINADSPFYQSFIGKHMRHILDHYQALPIPPEKVIIVNYHDRARDQRLEHDRVFAVKTAQSIIKEFCSIRDPKNYLREQLVVKDKEKVNHEKPEDRISSASSVSRELQFLISHTVHHYALIAIILRIQGVEPAGEFGVAPSTLRYREQQLKKSTG